ncbi:hypothetical protein PMAYCL1PPCAC_25473 [Pristionchus mayeri]|uniref:Uncharacterized protein n=1 Tax=Pristionchus mayeri TaxID=1317129 RepID=A0AAN5D2B8_9BILA|nr:hypothetical protein PMAYCL1PPCAC_25473 [Pristionchus mayeri]
MILNIILINCPDCTVSHILKLADQFQMKRVVKQAEKHLNQSNGIDKIKKLVLADKYGLESVKYYCLDSFTSLTEMTSKLKLSKELYTFSDGMKATICDRVVSLAKV